MVYHFYVPLGTHLVTLHHENFEGDAKIVPMGQTTSANRLQLLVTELRIK